MWLSLDGRLYTYIGRLVGRLVYLFRLYSYLDMKNNNVVIRRLRRFVALRIMIKGFNQFKLLIVFVPVGEYFFKPTPCT